MFELAGRQGLRKGLVRVPPIYLGCAAQHGRRGLAGERLQGAQVHAQRARQAVQLLWQQKAGVAQRHGMVLRMRRLG